MSCRYFLRYLTYLRGPVSRSVMERWQLLPFVNRLLYTIPVSLHPLCRYLHFLCWRSIMAQYCAFLVAGALCQPPTCRVQIYIRKSYVDSDPHSSVVYVYTRCVYSSSRLIHRRGTPARNDSLLRRSCRSLNPLAYGYHCNKQSEAKQTIHSISSRIVLLCGFWDESPACWKKSTPG